MRRLVSRAVSVVALVSAVLVVSGAREAGAAPATSRFVPLAPTRVLDTRIGLAGAGVVPPGGQLSVQFVGSGGIPIGATAVVLNVTLAEAVAPGYVQVFPTGLAAVGSSSNLNAEYPNQTLAGLVVVPVGVAGSVSFYTQGGGHLIADALGYFVPADASAAGRYQPVSPTRVLDTRLQDPGRLGAGAVHRLVVAGRAGLPATGVSAIVANVTATEASGAGFVQVFPTGTGTAVGSSSNLNVLGGQTVANLVVVPLGADGAVNLFTSGGTHLIVDVFGYFTDASAAATDEGLFVPVTPGRLLDTRSGAMPSSGAVVTVPAAGRAGLPSTGVAAIMGNVTATQATGVGYAQLMAGPRDGAPIGLFSNVNTTRPGQTIANAAVGNVGSDGSVLLYTSTASHLLLDVSGYFTGHGRGDGNHPPVAPVISLSVLANSDITIDIAHTASDPDGDRIDVTSVGNPSGGVLAPLGDGTYRYTPYSGTTSDHITYRVTDEHGAWADGRVDIIVDPTGPPIAPTDVRAEPVRLDNTTGAVTGTVRLVWFDRSDNETGFRITELSQGYCRGSWVTDVPANTQEATVTLHSYTGYRCGTSFTVQAVNGRGTSAPAWSATLPIPKAAPPAIVSFDRVGPNVYRLVWTADPAYGGYVTKSFSFGSVTGANTFTSIGNLTYSRYGSLYSGTLTVNGPTACGQLLAANSTGNVPYVSYVPAMDSLSAYACPGSPPPPPPYRLEAEVATRTPSQAPPPVMTDSPGYSGTGYVGFWGTAGQGVQFAYNAPTAGQYRLTIHYAQAGQDAPVSRQLLVNGSVFAMVYFPRSGPSWGSPGSWHDQTYLVTLPAGPDTIELRHPGPNVNNYLDLDYITIEPA